MRNRQRLAAVRQFVAERHGRPDDKRLVRLAEEAAPLKSGDQVYRHGELCIVVLVCYDEQPPHVVVRTPAGHEVDAKLDGSVSRKPPAADKAEAGRPVGAADAVDFGGDGDESSDRRAALARVRQRRAERACEAAQERDVALSRLFEGEGAAEAGAGASASRAAPRADAPGGCRAPPADGADREASPLIPRPPPVARAQGAAPPRARRPTTGGKAPPEPRGLSPHEDDDADSPLPPAAAAASPPIADSAQAIAAAEAEPPPLCEAPEAPALVERLPPPQASTDAAPPPEQSSREEASECQRQVASEQQRAEQQPPGPPTTDRPPCEAAPEAPPDEPPLEARSPPRSPRADAPAAPQQPAPEQVADPPLPEEAWDELPQEPSREPPVPEAEQRPPPPSAPREGAPAEDAGEVPDGQQPLGPPPPEEQPQAAPQACAEAAPEVSEAAPPLQEELAAPQPALATSQPQPPAQEESAAPQLPTQEATQPGDEQQEQQRQQEQRPPQAPEAPAAPQAELGPQQQDAAPAAPAARAAALETLPREAEACEFLDAIRQGWGAKFRDTFEAFGLELVVDLIEAPAEELQELLGRLSAGGAGPAHLRRIRAALDALRGPPASGDAGETGHGSSADMCAEAASAAEAATPTTGEAPQAPDAAAPLEAPPPAEAAPEAPPSAEEDSTPAAGAAPAAEAAPADATEAPPAEEAARPMAEADPAEAEASVVAAPGAEAAAAEAEAAPLEAEAAGALAEAPPTTEAARSAAEVAPTAEAVPAEAEAVTQSVEAAAPAEDEAAMEVEAPLAAEAAAPEAVEAQAVVAAVEDAGPQLPPVEVLLCLDTSLAMHVPLSLVDRPMHGWGEAEWDAFGRHLRERSEPCRLDPFGLRALELLARSLDGLAVEVRLCGGADAADDLERYCPLEVAQLGSRWKRAMRRDSNVWAKLDADGRQLRGRGLQSIIVLTAEDAAAPADDAGDVGGLGDGDVQRIAAVGVPVHVVALGAPSEAVGGAHAALAVATGGACAALEFSAACADGAAAKAQLGGVLRALRGLERQRPTAPGREPDLGFLRRRSARLIQRRARAHLRRRREERERRAGLKIAAAYACWRWRRCLASAADEGRRARRRAPIDAALRRRAAEKDAIAADAAAKRIQAEWRARKMRRWCQRVDRAARRLQTWCRRRWLAAKLQKEADRLRARAMYKVDKPPPPPSQWQQYLAPQLAPPPAAPEAHRAATALPALGRAMGGEGSQPPLGGAGMVCPPPAGPRPRPQAAARLDAPGGPRSRPSAPAPEALGALRSRRGQPPPQEEMLVLPFSIAAPAAPTAPRKAPQRSMAMPVPVPVSRVARAGGPGAAAEQPQPRCSLPSLRRPSPPRGLPTPLGGPTALGPAMRSPLDAPVVS